MKAKELREFMADKIRQIIKEEITIQVDGYSDQDGYKEVEVKLIFGGEVISKSSAGIPQ